MAKPLKGHCEAITGWDHEDGYDRMPTGIKCQRPGQWRPYGLMPFGSILCDDCYVSMLLRDAAKQNKAALDRLAGE